VDDSGERKGIDGVTEFQAEDLVVPEIRQEGFKAMPRDYTYKILELRGKEVTPQRRVEVFTRSAIFPMPLGKRLFVHTKVNKRLVLLSDLWHLQRPEPQCRIPDMQTGFRRMHERHIHSLLFHVYRHRFNDPSLSLIGYPYCSGSDHGISLCPMEKSNEPDFLT
jgi:hypothetical protein